jgi:hypothetical protein
MSISLEHVSGPYGRQSSEHLIVTEGADDAHFINEMLLDINANRDQVGICYVGGHTEISRFLGVVTKSQDYTQGRVKRIIVVRDSDSDRLITLRECDQYFQILGIARPEPGELVSSGERLFGLYLFPDCVNSGYLENLLMLAPSNDERMNQSRAFINAAATDVPSLDKLPKRICQSYLASYSSPLCAGVGRGVRNGAFAVNHSTLDHIKTFLRSFVQQA